MPTKGRKWKPGQAEKFRATMAARRSARSKVVHSETPIVKIPKHQDAIIYLRHAKDHITKSMQSGRLKKMDHAHLLTLLALSTLEGD